MVTGYQHVAKTFFAKNNFTNYGERPVSVSRGGWREHLS